MTSNELQPDMLAGEITGEPTTKPAGFSAAVGGGVVTAGTLSGGGAVTAAGPASRFTAADYEQIARGIRHRYVYRFAKRAFDIAFSLCVIVVLFIPVALVCLAIYLDDPAGPPIFAQKRVGLDGREFTMYKLRSMCVDAEARLEARKASNEKTGPVVKMADDPRITRVGRIIRKTSIDELPQFLNVLKGDMSVVGPRPALPREGAEYTLRDRLRLAEKPGITCYWQTRRNRDAIGFEEWVDLDLLYIQKAGFWTDLKIIVQTVGCVLTAQGE